MSKEYEDWVPPPVEREAFDPSVWPENVPTGSQPIMRLPNGRVLLRDQEGNGYEVWHRDMEFEGEAIGPLPGSLRDLPPVGDPITKYTNPLTPLRDAKLPGINYEQFAEKYPTFDALVEAFGEA